MNIKNTKMAIEYFESNLEDHKERGTEGTLDHAMDILSLEKYKEQLTKLEKENSL